MSNLRDITSAYDYAMNKENTNENGEIIKLHRCASRYKLHFARLQMMMAIIITASTSGSLEKIHGMWIKF